VKEKTVGLLQLADIGHHGAGRPIQILAIPVGAECLHLKKHDSLDEPFVAGSVDFRQVGRGCFFFGDPLAILPLVKVPRETLVDAGLAFERRFADGQWGYFIANRARTNFDGWITLARPARSVAVLDSLTGDSGVVAFQPAAGSGGARVRLQLFAGESLIVPPVRVVVDQLKPVDNVLDVEVTSVAANRVRDLDRRGGRWKIFKDINFVDVHYAPFDASPWPLTACGLLGPVTLTPMAAE